MVPFETQSITVAEINNLQHELNLCKLANGRFPTTKKELKALIEKPVTTDATEYRGPYLDQLPTDRWGNDFEHAFPGTRDGDPTNPDIWARGADGQADTDDDIGNRE